MSQKSRHSFLFFPLLSMSVSLITPVCASALLLCIFCFEIFETIGRQVLAWGHRYHPSEVLSMIDAVSLDQLRASAQKYLGGGVREQQHPQQPQQQPSGQPPPYAFICITPPGKSSSQLFVPSFAWQLNQLTNGSSVSSSASSVSFSGSSSSSSSPPSSSSFSSFAARTFSSFPSLTQSKDLTRTEHSE